MELVQSDLSQLEAPVPCLLLEALLLSAPGQEKTDCDRQLSQAGEGDPHLAHPQAAPRLQEPQPLGNEFRAMEARVCQVQHAQLRIVL